MSSANNQCADAHPTLAADTRSAQARAVVLALGSRFRGDDGVGPYVLDLIADHVRQSKRIDAIEGAEDAMALINAWQEADLAVVIDAAVSGVKPGTVHRLDGGAQLLTRELAGCSSHGLGLAEAVELARLIGRMPQRLLVYAIEVATLEAGAPLSAAVRAAANTVNLEIRTQLAPYEDSMDCDPQRDASESDDA